MEVSEPRPSSNDNVAYCPPTKPSTQNSKVIAGAEVLDNQGQQILRVSAFFPQPVNVTFAGRAVDQCETLSWASNSPSCRRNAGSSGDAATARRPTSIAPAKLPRRA
jgi:hypothetical protein